MRAEAPGSEGDGKVRTASGEGPPAGTTESIAAVNKAASQAVRPLVRTGRNLRHHADTKSHEIRALAEEHQQGSTEKALNDPDDFNRDALCEDCS